MLLVGFDCFVRDLVDLNGDPVIYAGIGVTFVMSLKGDLSPKRGELISSIQGKEIKRF